MLFRSETGAQTNSVNPNFDPALHRTLYVDFVPSRLNLANDGETAIQRAAVWRNRMNAALQANNTIEK